MLHKQVLIVGAGPTGLMMACQLALLNIPFRIIDKTVDHVSQSRALLVQARSLEIFDQMGIAEKAIESGVIAGAFGVYWRGKRLGKLLLKDLGRELTKYPFFLILEQWRTEELLLSFLKERNKAVERRVELVQFTQQQNGVEATLLHPGGREETCKVDYLIGADGAHSAVRKGLGLDFSGETYSASMFVLDCHADLGKVPHNEAYLALSKQGLAGFFPLPNGVWRIIGRLPKGITELSFEEIARDLPKQIERKMTLTDPKWLATYRVHHRYASHFRDKRVFLMGDAAHIHSPVGGQGMNTGLQDAYNLAWKLAHLLQGRANDELLNTYEEERLRIAKALVKTTDRIFHLLSSEKRWVKWIRGLLLPLGFRSIFAFFKRSKKFRRKFFSLVSEVGIHYRFGSLAKDASQGVFPECDPKPGDRWADFHPTRKGVKWHLFLPKGKKWSPVEEAARTALHGLIEITYLPASSPGYFLVRPDFYVACRGQEALFLTSYIAKFIYHS